MLPNNDQAPRGHWLLSHARVLAKDPLTLLDGCSGGVVPLRLNTTAWLVLESHDVLHVLSVTDGQPFEVPCFRSGIDLTGAMFESWMVFMIAAGVLIVTSVHDGSIHP